MKFLQLLAAELTEWPKGNASHLVCSASGEIFATKGGAPVFDGSDSNLSWTILGAGCGEYVYWEDIESFTLSSVPSDHATDIVTRADWEAERAKLKAPKANGDGWVRNRGRSDKPPVADDVMVQVVLRDESKNSFDEKPHPAKNWVWRHRAIYSDLMWYRIHKPAEQPEPVSEPIISFEDMKPGMTVRFVRYTGGCHRHWSFVPGKMYSVGSDGYSVGPISDKGEVPNMNWGFEFALVGSVAEPAEQPQIKLESGAEISYSPGEPLVSMEPADTMLAIRDRIRELDTQRAEVESTYQRQISEITQERESFVQKLAGEGLALVEAVVQPVKSLDDWRNWQAGDVVEVTLENYSDLAVGSQYVVRSVEEEEYDGAMHVSVWTGGDWNWPQAQDESGRCVFKFVSRPAS
jgi:hypothetical protein